MLNSPLLAGLSASTVETPRLRTHIISGGPADGEAIVLVHGNVSAARFFEELMVTLSARYRVIAPDLRGYGRTATAPLDATRGLRDFSDDLHALVQTLGVQCPHLLGWSLGGTIAMQYAIDHPDAVASLTLVAPGSPYGFGGTRDLQGTPTTPSFAGTGGGTANPEFVKRLAARDRSEESPSSPRSVMNAFYFKPPFRSPCEEVFVDEMLAMAVGDANYPGNAVPVSEWPGIGPGTQGVNNALSPKYCNLGGFAAVMPQPPVLWIRGDSDQIVSDTSLFDFGFLGQIGVVPDWPGVEAFPPQPMVGQMRAVLQGYAAHGGRYDEVVLQDCGHSPHIEQPEAFEAVLREFFDGISVRR
ncbi:MAG: alpha/beta hydrolase [Chloroflexota bacterium]|nr:alpha/beta hydrolase [Chloroflexota bacterium]